MRLSLKTKFTLATSLLVLAVVAVVSGLYLGRLTRQVLRQADDRARFVAQQVFLRLPERAGRRGRARRRARFDESRRPARVRSADARQQQHAEFADRIGCRIFADDLRNHDQRQRRHCAGVERRFAARPESGGAAERRVAGARRIFQAASRRCMGRRKPTNSRSLSTWAPALSAKFASGFPPRCCATKFRRALISAGYWALGSVLLSTLLAFLVSRITLAPLERISAQLDRISAGQFDPEPAVERGDELGAVSTKITGIGKQLRDVREIFSTLRENLDQVMSGLEDGLLLFNAEGRAVLVSPSVEKFLGGRPTNCGAGA